MIKYELLATQEFRKIAAKLIKSDKSLSDKILKVLRILAIDPFYKGLKTHKVNTRNHGEKYSSRVTGDLRIIWDFVNGKAIIITFTIGGHSGSRKVYK